MKRLMLALAVLSVPVGCAFLRPVEVEYVSNDNVLQSVAISAYHVDPKFFETVSADVRDDALTFHYRGRVYPGDSAWVVRFSEKGTEQDPLTLRDIYTVLPAVSEGRRLFQVLDDGEVPWQGSVLRFVRYRFESAVRDASGTPLEGRGILAAIAGKHDGGWVVYRFKLDNHGDRQTLDWQALLPFLEPLPDD
jgi:hypothetical protein